VINLKSITIILLKLKMEIGNGTPLVAKKSLILFNSLNKKVTLSFIGFLKRFTQQSLLS